MASNLLKDTTIKAAKCPADKPFIVLSDGDCLSLHVMATGGKLWRYRYRFNGLAKTLSMGKYPEVGAALARARRDEARRQLIEGRDPSQVKKTTKRIANGLGDTFAEIASSMVKVKADEWSAKHLERTNSLLKRELYPALGHRVLREIELPELIDLLKLIEGRGTLASLEKVRAICSLVWRHAVQIGKAKDNITRDMAGAFKAVSSKHFSAITNPEIFGQLLRSIDAYHGGLIVKAALRLAPMLFQRPTELRGMAWGELDLEAGMWTIASARMKRTKEGKENGEPHLVPLPVQAVAILQAMRPITGGGVMVFRSERDHTKPMSENTLRVALLSMGYAPEVQTVHGFRATARTMLAEVLEVDPLVIEQQLAHSVKDSLGRAYNRTQYIKQRTAMMQKWADYLDILKSEKVIQLKRKAA